MIENNEFAWRLSQIINDLYIEYYDQDWINISQWLQLSACLYGVDIDTTQYEDIFHLDTNILDYEEKREKVLSSFIKKIASFQFTWCALECIVDKIISENQKIKYYGKINAIGKYLSDNYKNKELIFYNRSINELYMMLNDDLYYSKKIKYIKKLNDNKYKYDIKDNGKLIGSINNNGIALVMIYKIRNRFAHGSMRVPIIPIDYEEDYDMISLNILNLSHRLLLMSIQMILITINNNIEIDDRVIRGDNKTKLFDILLNLHIR